MRCVYTIISHGYDTLKAPIIEPGEDVRMLAVILYNPRYISHKELVEHYSDPNLRWELSFRATDAMEAVLKLEVKSLRYQPWEILGDDWDVAMYVDGAYLINGLAEDDVRSLSKSFDLVEKSFRISCKDPDRNFDLCGQVHPQRTNVIDEAEACEARGVLPKGSAARYAKNLKNWGMQPPDILFECGIFLVRNTEPSRLVFLEMVELLNDMLDDLGAVRDQLALPLAIDMLSKRNDPPFVAAFPSGHLSSLVCAQITNHLESMDESFEVKYSVPYSVNKNLGKAYNQFFDSLEPNQWGASMDMDMMFTDSRFGIRIHQVISENKDKFDVLVPVTNHMNSKGQLAFTDIDASPDMKRHAVIEETRWEACGTHVRAWSDKGNSFPGGMMIIMKKDSWEKVRFLPGLLGIDKEFFYRCRQEGLRVGLMLGIYCYHWHRGEVGLQPTHLL